MFYGDSETGQTLPQDFIFLKEQWTLNNISMFVQLPNDISSAVQQFFFPTKHGLKPFFPFLFHELSYQNFFEATTSKLRNWFCNC